MTNETIKRAILWDQSEQCWNEYLDCVEVVSANNLDHVIPALKAIEDQVNQEGLTAVGYLSYESSPAFDSALPSKTSGDLPLLCFGLFRTKSKLEIQGAQNQSSIKNLDWESMIDRDAYGYAFDKIKSKIENGDTYQVNFTYRLRTKFDGDPFALFQALLEDQVAPYAAYLEYDEWALCSVSPELFFKLNGKHLSSKPMKGTAKRGLWAAQDLQHRADLEASEKERAENVMIVDMIRNDMGRVAESNSVKVRDLFETEQYPTLWQMISTVECQTEASLVEILQAMFPCASITGAPKRSTMGIIQDLEKGPRDIYTGSIGYIAPGRESQFNVAIRTVLVNKPNATAEYGIGGGIVWDSVEDNEWKESILKSKVLNRGLPEFSLLETMLCEPEIGVALLPYHLSRLRESARYFGYDSDLGALETEIATLAKDLGEAKKIRVLWSRSGSYELEVHPIKDRLFPKTIGLSKESVDSSNVFLYHKTTERKVYHEIIAQHDHGQDVILFNERDEPTETSIANIALEIEGQFLTPPISSGLLGGTMRAKLLEEGVLKERVLTRDDLNQASHIYLMNATRGIQKVGKDGGWGAGI